jgi:hypothetical protein
MRSLTYSLLLILVILTLGILLVPKCNAQTVSVVFEWTDPNKDPCTYDVYEVQAPPDTDKIAFVVNRDPIPNCKEGCSWTGQVYTDGPAIRYYRMRAFRDGGYYSAMSNTAILDFDRTIRPPYITKVHF